MCSTDVSEVVIDRMKKAPDSLSRPSLRWCVDDACASSFADGAFDAVLDKGLIDCLMCESQEAVAKAVGEAGRVLRPGGRHIVLCFTNKDEVVRLMVRSYQGRTCATAGSLSLASCATVYPLVLRPVVLVYPVSMFRN